MMAMLTLCLAVYLSAFAPITGQGNEGPCQPYKTNSTPLCDELQKLIQENGNHTFCNKPEFSCSVNYTGGQRPLGRSEYLWSSCYCDSLCQQLGDCCVDYDLWFNKSSPSQSSLKLSCRRKPSHAPREILGYVMVSSCPSTWHDVETSLNCMSTNYTANPAIALPLIDETTNVTYANIYCALCHGKASNLLFWNVRVWMPGRNAPVSLDTISSPDSIWEVFPLTEEFPKKCIVTPADAKTAWKTVNETKFKQLCRSYANAVNVMDLNFKNVHCALLSGSNLSEVSVNCAKSHGRPHPRLRSMLFVFTKYEKPLQRIEAAVRTKYNCHANELYDPFQARCLPLHAQPSVTWKNPAKNGSKNASRSNVTDQCRGPRFSSGEFQILSNGSAFIVPHRKTYNETTYVLVNRTLILCSAFSRNGFKRSTRAEEAKKTLHSTVIWIITYVGFSLSTVCLLFLLVTFSLFAELRTYPGKKVMHLSCAMIALQLVYFASDSDVVSSPLCAMLGVMLHYLVLTVFLWMSVIAYNTQKQVTTMDVDIGNSFVVRAKRRTTYVRNFAFSWGLPFLVVGACVTMQLTQTGNVGYGSEDGCQLSPPARMFAVAVPVSSMLLFNIGALIRAAVALARIRGQGNVPGANQGSLPLILLRLTSLIGITWILGFILAFYPSLYLEYPFIILNSSQGVMICLSFACKKRIFTLYKQRFVAETEPEPQDEQAHENKYQTRM